MEYTEKWEVVFTTPIGPLAHVHYLRSSFKAQIFMVKSHPMWSFLKELDETTHLSVYRAASAIRERLDALH